MFQELRRAILEILELDEFANGVFIVTLNGDSVGVHHCNPKVVGSNVDLYSSLLEHVADGAIALQVLTACCAHKGN